ncbi:MAG: cytochrome C oxidase subunit IV family protein [Oligoflexia bacterium]|nr:cytochrome C oxidase subunit IV family protein [Oligoflexia bacterium]
MSKNHSISFKIYLTVLVILLILTVITVGVAQVDFGMFNAFFAMLIATVKAGLVLMYFMHLKYDEKLYWLIFGSAVFFVVLLYFFSELDIVTRVIQNSVL